MFSLLQRGFPFVAVVVKLKCAPPPEYIHFSTPFYSPAAPSPPPTPRHHNIVHASDSAARADRHDKTIISCSLQSHGSTVVVAAVAATTAPHWLCWSRPAYGLPSTAPTAKGETSSRLHKSAATRPACWPIRPSCPLLHPHPRVGWGVLIGLYNPSLLCQRMSGQCTKVQEHHRWQASHKYCEIDLISCPVRSSCDKSHWPRSGLILIGPTQCWVSFTPWT